MREQTWIIGSNTSNIEAVSDAGANRGWDVLEILYSKILNGMFNKVDTQGKIISDEICNFLTNAGITVDPTNSSQMATVYNNLRNEIAEVVTKTFSFKGYVSTTEPSSSTYSLNTGDMWINSATMPATIPVSASDIKIWNGTSWANATENYSPVAFDTFSNLEDEEGYYWFGGEWKVVSTDLSLDYFSLNPTTGKWEISSTYDNTLVHKSGDETINDEKTFTARTIKKTLEFAYNDSSTSSGSEQFNQIAFFDKNNYMFGALEFGKRANGNLFAQMNMKNPTTGNWMPTPLGFEQVKDTNGTSYTYCLAPNSDAAGNEIATASWVLSKGVILPGTILAWGGSSVPAGYLACDGASISRTTYANLFSAIGTTWGSDSSSTFKVPNFTDGTAPLGSNDTLGSYRTGEIPKITGRFFADGLTFGWEGGEEAGALYHTMNDRNYGCNSKYYKNGNCNINFDAYRSSSAYNRTDNKVVPAGYVVRYIIKY